MLKRRRLLAVLLCAVIAVAPLHCVCADWPADAIVELPQSSDCHHAPAADPVPASLDTDDHCSGCKRVDGTATAKLAKGAFDLAAIPVAHAPPRGPQRNWSRAPIPTAAYPPSPTLVALNVLLLN